MKSICFYSLMLDTGTWWCVHRKSAVLIVSLLNISLCTCSQRVLCTLLLSARRRREGGSNKPNRPVCHWAVLLLMWQQYTDVSTSTTFSPSATQKTEERSCGVSVFVDSVHHQRPSHASLNKYQLMHSVLGNSRRWVLGPLFYSCSTSTSIQGSGPLANRSVQNILQERSCFKEDFGPYAECIRHFLRIRQSGYQMKVKKNPSLFSLAYQEK